VSSFIIPGFCKNRTGKSFYPKVTNPRVSICIKCVERTDPKTRPYRPESAAVPTGEPPLTILPDEPTY
jgi:hypothetical protein